MMRGLLAFQPRQPLLRILNLNNARVSVFLQVEEFLRMLYGFFFVPFFMCDCNCLFCSHPCRETRKFEKELERIFWFFHQMILIITKKEMSGEEVKNVHMVRHHGDR